MHRDPFLSQIRMTDSPGVVQVVLSLIVLLCMGCGSSSTTLDATADASMLEQHLRAAASDWEGTPHRWGGTSRRGVDCSGLVQSVYADLFEVSLPRTTREQARVGKQVRAGRRAPGDLVFFKTGAKTRHVGMYLGRGEFFHASSSAGVTISRLDAPYWQRTYWTTRRIFDEASPLAPATASSSAEPIPTPSRTGW